MGVSKVVYGDDTLVDLTGDTVTPTSLTLGATAHGADGEPIVGEYQYTLPVASPTTRGGARIQPDSGLEITDTDNLQVRLALESDGTVRGGIAELTAKGHAEQVATTGKNLLPITATSQTANGITFTVNADGSVTANGTVSGEDVWFLLYRNFTFVEGNTYTLSGCPSGGATNRYFIEIDALNHRDIGNGASYVAEQDYTDSIYICIRNGVTVSNLTFYPMLRLASITDDTYEPYTGGAPSPSPEFPQTIEVVRGHEVTGNTGRFVDMEVQGRNLLPNTVANKTISGVVFAANADGSVTANGTASQPYYSTYMDLYMFNDELSGKEVTFSANRADDSSNLGIIAYANVGGSYTELFSPTSGSVSITIPNNATVVLVRAVAINSGVTKGTIRPMLELGSTAHEYQLYYHETRAIPLPQRGWVAGLPDGTADALRLDGAGKCEWTLPTSMETFDGSSDEDIRTGGNFIFSTNALDTIYESNYATPNIISSHFQPTYVNALISGTIGVTINQYKYALFNITGESITVEEGVSFLQSNPVTVLYPLATPVTEDCGYVDNWPTDIPEGAVVSCPELDAVGVKYFIDSAVTELAKQWYARAYAELGDAVTELAGRVAALES